jgi:PAS domain S-box-containing protein
MLNVVAVLLLTVQILIIVQLLLDRHKNKAAEAQLILLSQRLRLAIQTGKSVGWDWDIASGRYFWFGDLRSFFGIPSDTYSTQEFFNDVHPEDRQRLADALSDAKQNHKLYSTEFRISSPERPTRWVSSRGEFQYAPDGTATRMLGLAVDITENKGVEDALRESEEKAAHTALRESEERFRLVMNNVAVGVSILDLEGLVTYLNPAAEEMLGWTSAELLGRNMHDVTHHRHPDGTAFPAKDCAVWRVSKEGIELREHEDVFIRKNGEFFPVVYSASPLKEGDNPGILIVFRDETYRRQAEREVHESEEEIEPAAPIPSTMSQRLIEAQEAERALIAGELHDDIGQRLVLLGLLLGNLERSLPVALPALGKDLEQVRQQLKTVVEDVQSLSHSLHPSRATHLGLAKAAQNFCSELSAQNVDIEFQSENVPADLAEPISLCLYRVLQEALQNAMKHSGSRDFQVVLTGGPNEIHLSVHDSGIGFDPLMAMKGQGIGLLSMKERLKLVKGSLSIDSIPFRGTTVHARVPLNLRQKARGTGV